MHMWTINNGCESFHKSCCKTSKRDFKFYIASQQQNTRAVETRVQREALTLKCPKQEGRKKILERSVTMPAFASTPAWRHIRCRFSHHLLQPMSLQRPFGIKGRAQTGSPHHNSRALRSSIISCHAVSPAQQVMNSHLFQRYSWANAPNVVLVSFAFTHTTLAPTSVASCLSPQHPARPQTTTGALFSGN